MNTKKIAFIGAGNMARSMVGGLVTDGYDPKNIWVSNPHSEKLAQIATNWGVHTDTDNNVVAAVAEIIVFCVKPNVLAEVAKECEAVIQANNPLVITIAAGKRVEFLEKHLGRNTAIVRCMPNTPALIGCAATGLFANARVSDQQKSLAESILRAIGVTVWLDAEAQMDTVTALSGSGPAYFFLMMEALEAAAVECGLPTETARFLTLQTAVGASRMALESQLDTASLRQQVTSPGGTTEAAIQSLESENIRNLFSNAVRAAAKRSADIADEA